MGFLKYCSTVMTLNIIVMLKNWRKKEENVLKTKQNNKGSSPTIKLPGKRMKKEDIP